MKWKGTAIVDVVDPVLVRAALPLLLDRLRKLEVRDEMLVHPDTGRPMPRLRVLTGAHPVRGTMYEAIEHRTDNMPIEQTDGTFRVAGHTLSADDPRTARSLNGVDRVPTTTRSTIELVADDSQRFEVAVIADGGMWTLTLAEPRRPTTLTVSGLAPGGSSWWTKGDMTSHVQIRLADFVTSAAENRAPITGHLVHRRFVMKGEANIETVDSRCHLHVDAVARARGVVRPLGGAAGMLFGWLIRRQLTKTLAKWEHDGAPPIRRLANDVGPAQLADGLLHDLLAPFTDEDETT
jgi:hypothetical protein